MKAHPAASVGRPVEFAIEDYDSVFCPWCIADGSAAKKFDAGSESGWTDSEIDEYLDSLDVDDEPCAYLFQCRHCGTHLAYSDFG